LLSFILIHGPVLGDFFHILDVVHNDTELPFPLTELEELLEGEPFHVGRLLENTEQVQKRVDLNGKLMVTSLDQIADGDDEPL